MFESIRSFTVRNFRKVKVFYANKFVRHTIRGGRVIFLSFVLYSTGYNSGLLDYAQDPAFMDKKLMTGVLQGTHAKDILPSDHPLSRRAHRIGSRIVASAISYTSYQLKEIASRKEDYLYQLAELKYGRLTPLAVVKEKNSSNVSASAGAAIAGAIVSSSVDAGTHVSKLYPSRPLGTDGPTTTTTSKDNSNSTGRRSLSSSINSSDAKNDNAAAGKEGEIDNTPLSKTELDALVRECDEELEQWENIRTKLRSADSWSYLVTDSAEVNAFVTDLLPRRIFINKGLFDTVVPTDDELALVLGHEISHLILDHVPENMQYEAFLLGFQLLLFSFVDPTGLLSFIFDSVISQVRVFMNASRSRECELQADSLGVIIAGRACFNVEKGINVMSKLMHMDRHKTLPVPVPVSVPKSLPSVVRGQVADANTEAVDTNTVSVGTDLSSSSAETKRTNEASSSPQPSPRTVPMPMPVPGGRSPSAQWSDTHPPFESRIELLLEAHDRFADSKAHTSHCLDIESDLMKGFYHVMHRITDSVSDSVNASLDTPVHPGAMAGGMLPAAGAATGGHMRGHAGVSNSHQHQQQQ